MYPYYKGKQGSQVVGYDDVLAMYELYSEQAQSTPSPSFCYNTSVKNQPAEDTAAAGNVEDDYNVGSETPAADDDNQYDYAADQGDYYDDNTEEGDRGTTTAKTTTSTTTRTTMRPTTTGQK